MHHETTPDTKIHTPRDSTGFQSTYTTRQLRIPNYLHHETTPDTKVYTPRDSTGYQSTYTTRQHRIPKYIHRETAPDTEVHTPRDSTGYQSMELHPLPEYTHTTRQQRIAKCIHHKVLNTYTSDSEHDTLPRASREKKAGRGKVFHQSESHTKLSDSLGSGLEYHTFLPPPLPPEEL